MIALRLKEVKCNRVLLMMVMFSTIQAVALRIYHNIAIGERKLLLDLANQRLPNTHLSCTPFLGANTFHENLRLQNWRRNGKLFLPGVSCSDRIRISSGRWRSAQEGTERTSENVCVPDDLHQIVSYLPRYYGESWFRLYLQKMGPLQARAIAALE